MFNVANLACHHRGVAVAGIKKELLNLVAADVAENAAEVATIVEPLRTTAPFPVRTGSQGLHDAANRALQHQLSGKDRALYVQTLAVIHRVFLPGLRHHCFGIGQLFKGGERRFIREIVLTRGHRFQPQCTAPGRDGGTRHQAHLVVVEYHVQRRRHVGLRILLDEFIHLRRIGVVHPFQRGAGFNQAVAHAVNMTVVECGSGKNKFTFPDNRLRFTYRGVVHSVFLVHDDIPRSRSFPRGMAPTSLKLATLADFS